MMKKIVLCCVVLLCGLRADSLEVLGFTPDEVVTYKTVGDVTLTMDLFYPNGHPPSDPRPAIIFFHGGAWAGGEKSQMHAHCAYLASRGMVTMSAEYRVKNQHGTTPKECVIDGKSAVRWVRVHAAELGVDPRRIAAGGASAGGHVAAATATVHGFDEDLDPSVSCVPNALVLYNPVFDNSEGNYGFARVKAYWKQISPAHNITKDTPPTVVFFGTDDVHVPIETAKRYKRWMDEAGARCVLHIYPGEQHKFFNFRYTENYISTTRQTDAFLVSLGYLRGEPTVEKQVREYNERMGKKTFRAKKN